MAEALRVLGAWTLAPLPILGGLIAGALYLIGVRRVRSERGRSAWAPARTLAFMSGLILCLFVLVGPPGAFDRTYFVAHMVQHIVLMMVAPPLMLLGAPILLLLESAGRPARRRWIVPLLRSRPVGALTHPVVSWLIFAGVLLGTHFTPFYDFALTHPLVHDLIEHPLYLTAGFIYYAPLLVGHGLPRVPTPGLKIVSLLAQMVPETMTGFFLYASGYVIFPSYAATPRILPLSPLMDQQLGGALMWSSGMVIDVIWICVAVRAWLRFETRRGMRIDRESAVLIAEAARGRST